MTAMLPVVGATVRGLKKQKQRVADLTLYPPKPTTPSFWQARAAACTAAVLPLQQLLICHPHRRVCQQPDPAAKALLSCPEPTPFRALADRKALPISLESIGGVCLLALPNGCGNSGDYECVWLNGAGDMYWV